MLPEVLSYLCPFCDSQVRVGSPCPGCLKKSKTARRRKRSWEQDPGKDGLDLPDDDFDYDAFVAREFGKTPPHRALGLKWYWWLLGVVVLAGMVASVFWLG